MDSHVAILRPIGITPLALVYFLASPLGQLQFQRFESGASGQTSVTDEDLRRFRIPSLSISAIELAATQAHTERSRIIKLRSQLDEDESQAWGKFIKCVI